MVAKDAQRLSPSHLRDHLVHLTVIADDVTQADDPVDAVEDIGERIESLEVGVKITDHGNADYVSEPIERIASSMR